MKTLFHIYLLVLCVFSVGHSTDARRTRERAERVRNTETATQETEHETGVKFGEGFRNFTEEYGYKGGSVGVLLGNRLGYAEGVGHTVTGHNIRTETLFPVSSVSKSITAVAILKLIQDGYLHPQDKIFGNEGILSKIEAFDKGREGDARLHDITVDDLLRHAGGWDASLSEVSDPLFNEVLVERNPTMPNITKDMNLTSFPTSMDIIKYMMGRKLDFTPGTQSTPSNLGYTILGRVIEEVTDIPYEEYVKDTVLTQCGMWHTRLGPHQDVRHLRYGGRSARDISQEIKDRQETVSEFYAYNYPQLVDSCHGWFSNAYDLMRFMQCIDGSNGYRLLNSTTINLLTDKPRAGPQHTETWFGAGFHIHHHGAMWVDAETYASNVILFHRNLHRHRDGDTYSGRENVPIAWVYLLEGTPVIDAPLKQLSKAMVGSESHWPTKDAYFDDISDTSTTVGGITKIVKLKVEEHRANRFLIALKRNLYDVQWVNAFTHEEHTFITVVAEKNPQTSQMTVSVAGLTLDKFVSTKLSLEKEGYNMTSLQNYKSFSHRDSYMFLAQFRKAAFRNGSHLMYGLKHFDRPYKALLGLFEEKGYRPLVQSVEYRRDDALVSFILEAETEEDQTSIYSSQSSMSESRLESNVKKYAVQQQKKLVYLDASNHRGKPRFSGLFKKTKMTKWLFSVRLSDTEVIKIIADKQREGYLPTLIVGYSNKDMILQYAIYMEKPSPSV